MWKYVGAVAGTIWALISLYFVVLFVLRKWHLRKFTGPFAIPFLGNCYTAEALSFLRYLAVTRKKFGKIFTIFTFAKAYLVICDPVVVRRILSDTGKFRKGADYSDIFAIGFGEGLVTSTGEKHKKDRGIFSKYFLKANISNYATVLNRETKRIIEQRMDPSMKMETPTLNMEGFFAVLALRCFTMFCMNFDITEAGVEREEALCKYTSEGSWAVAYLMQINIPAWSIFPPVKLIQKYCDEIERTVLPQVDKRRLAMKNGTLPPELDDCLTAMIRENMAEKDILDHVRTLIGAGHDTTAFFSSYMSYMLALHQDVQDKVRKEIFDVVGDAEDVSFEQIGQLKYLQKVMQETLRMYAVIPILTRESTEDVTIKEAGVTIPKGATLMMPLFLMNRDPTLWDKPAEYNPDRFDELSSADASFTSAKSGFFPFGYGSRTCIGNTLSVIENSIFMCQILRKYRFIPKPGYKPNILSGISLTTSNGVHVNLEAL